MALFIGDDWAEDHHDILITDEHGKKLTKARLPEGLAGIERLHALVAEHLTDADVDPVTGHLASDRVVVGIETDRGTWVVALAAAGYTVYALNPMQTARYRERYSTSGAKSDAADAAVLARIVRQDREHHRPLAADSTDVVGLKIATRAHQSLIWDRTRHLLRLRSTLLAFYPAALQAFGEVGIELGEADCLELLAAAPDPDRAQALSRSKIAAMLRRAGRREVEAKAEAIQAVLRAAALRQPDPVQRAYAASVSASVGLLVALRTQIGELGQVVGQGFGQHPAAEIYLSQPGLGPVLGARMLAEFGDAPGRYRDARARKNYAGTSPITRRSGTRKNVLARYARNRHLADTAYQQAFCALQGSPGARAYYDACRARGANHNAALRQLANRLIGILHGCLRHGTLYDEAIAWPCPAGRAPVPTPQPAAAAA